MSPTCSSGSSSGGAHSGRPRHRRSLSLSFTPLPTVAPPPFPSPPDAASVPPFPSTAAATSALDGALAGLRLRQSETDRQITPGQPGLPRSPTVTVPPPRSEFSGGLPLYRHLTPPAVPSVKRSADAGPAASLHQYRQHRLRSFSSTGSRFTNDSACSYLIAVRDC
ncbi:hypothetical protein HK405_007095 [Cladochytrium tenue]|nr:hypothetical protein HK405_007095 [Cladochytrium tenue]